MKASLFCFVIAATVLIFVQSKKHDKSVFNNQWSNSVDESYVLHRSPLQRLYKSLKVVIEVEDSDSAEIEQMTKLDLPNKVIKTSEADSSESEKTFDAAALPEYSKRLKKPCYKKSQKPLEHKTYPRSWDHAGFEVSLPREWDWRNVSGINYCSPTRNQHIPVYCGACWVFGSLGALNDRFNIARKNRWPMTMLSPQEVIDCNGKGSCQGGEASDVYGHAKIQGLVEEGCNVYQAINQKCNPYNRCGTCWPDSCDEIQNYTRYYIKDFGPLQGREKMMAEIHNRGPIACSIGGTPKFDFNYTGGIYMELSNLTANHMTAVTGWGIDEATNTEYWIVRNSWGEAWGDKGWFNVVTSLYKNGKGDDYNMGIERDCYYADPDVSNLD